RESESAAVVLSPFPGGGAAPPAGKESGFTVDNAVARVKALLLFSTVKIRPLIAVWWEGRYNVDCLFHIYVTL
ncbi:hypothetical protein, partial [Klebsiella oxytoca]|uniref:hypothetical protein n=1 Tax=Klebsiella oxytoca TaxID=571 RepID=UPI0034D1686B